MKRDMIETMRMAEEYMENIRIYVPLIIEYYRNYQIEQASNDIQNLIEGLMWLEEVFNLIEGEYDINREELRKAYDEILTAMKNRDYLLIADVLEYEFMPAISVIQKVMEGHLSNLLN